MHLTITTLVVSDDAKHAKKFWTHTNTLRRRYPSTELAMLPIEDLDDPNNTISIWSNVAAADIVVCLISEEFLTALDDLTDAQSGNNLIRDEIVAKRQDPQFRIIPVILNQCTWDNGTVFARLQALPYRGTIKQMNTDEAWCNVAQRIEDVMKSLYKQYQQGATQQPQAVLPQPKTTTSIAPSFCRKCGDPLPANATYCTCGTTVTVKHSISVPTRSAPIQQVVSTPTQATKQAFILVYSSKDKTIAEECLRQLKTWGIDIIDSLDIAPGSLLREAFKSKMQKAAGVIFLVSADLINDMWEDERLSVQTQARIQTPQTLLADSYMVIIRPCHYDNLFVGAQQPQVIFSVDGKPITSSKRKEESWFALGQQLQAQLTS
jgi:hypothetical protein